MAIFDILKKDLFNEGCDCEKDDAIIEEEKSIEGDPQALVDGMLENAPGSKEHIGVILKYAANSIPDYDIWDAALDYYESIGDEGTGNTEVEEPVDDEPTNDDGEDELPLDEPSDDEVPSEEPSGDPVEDDEELTM